MVMMMMMTMAVAGLAASERCDGDGLSLVDWLLDWW
jgi:hypothetical protein